VYQFSAARLLSGVEARLLSGVEARLPIFFFYISFQHLS
jgi:hypothetical protein